MVTKAYLLRRNIHPDVWKLLHSKRHGHHVLKSLHKGLLGHDPCGGCGSELCETEEDSFIRSVLTFEFRTCKVHVYIDGSWCIPAPRDLFVRK